MSKKVYNKVGRLNYKEKKLITKIEEAIAQKLEKDPSFTFEPASDYNELQNMYYKYAVDDVVFEEVKKDDTLAPKNEKEGKSFFDNDDDTFVDPMNREEPIVRDYVMNNEFGGGARANATPQTDFAEPISFEESFAFPTDDTNPNNTQGNTNGGQGVQRQQKGVQKSPPINPEFDEMSNGRKRKSTKKFAKYIVSAVAMLQEKGFVWYATKEINEPKLLEYELTGEMDLSLLLSLDGGQEVTIKDFFKSQCELANELAKIEQSKLDDLTDVLAEVMMEKGVAPTPQQELLLIGGSIIAEQVLKMVAFNSQIKGVLNQLRSMKAESMPKTQATTPPPPKPQPPKEEEPMTYAPQDYAEQVYNGTPVEQPIEGNFDDLEEMIINNPLETKE
jgi:uncharacterized coiled-coil protein SlyX